MRIVSQSEAMQTLPELLEDARRHSVVICENDREIGVLVSMEDFDIIRRTRVRELLALCDEMSSQVQQQAAKEGIGLEDLEKELLTD